MAHLDALKALAARFWCCAWAELAAMNCAPLWAFCAYLKAKAEGG